MKGIALIRACALLPIVDPLRATDPGLESLLQKTRLPASTFDHPEALIPLHQASSLLAHTFARGGAAGAGLLAGDGIFLAALGDYGRLLLHSPSLGAALEAAARSYPLYSSGGCLRLVADGDRAWLRHGQDRRLVAGRDEAEQWSVLLALHFVRAAADPEWCPSELELCARSAPGLDGMPLLARTRIRFGQLSTGIAIPRALLQRPLLRLPERSPSREELEQRLAASAPAPDFPGSIQQVVRTLLRDGYPHVARSADAIGMSVRTLQRRLRESDVSYSELVERERLDCALRLLIDSRATLTDVAIRLGYADLANFSHAFRRWLGTAPSRFRRELAHAWHARDAA